MRKLLILVGVIICNMLPLNVLLAESVNGSTDMLQYISSYKDVINTYNDFLSAKQDGLLFVNNSKRSEYDYFPFGAVGVSILTIYANNVGYCLMDINNDRIPEMIVSSHDTSVFPNHIFDLFTLNDGEPKRIVASSNRMRYQLLSDNSIYYQAASDAGHGFCTLYRLNNDNLDFIKCIVFSYSETQQKMLHYEIFQERKDLYTYYPETDREITADEYSRIQASWDSLVQQLSLVSIPKFDSIGILRLPKTLTIIEKDAFEGTAINAAIIPQECVDIDSNAFSNCRNLFYIQIPEDIANFIENIFGNQIFIEKTTK